MAAQAAEQVQQKKGAHVAMVAIGAVCLIVATVVAVLGRASGSTVEKVGDTTTTKSWPSETLITSLLAVGAVLIIVGFLWARITTIKVAGAEVALSDAEKKDVADTLTEKVPEDADPKEAAAATVNVMTALTEEKATSGPLTQAKISAVADQHFEGLTTSG
jgi:heme/copper-type cytochrome/quinol oxidase subunit 2